MTSTVRGVDNFDSSPVRSMIRVHTSNGWGSTNSAIRRFLTLLLSQGTDITYTPSATLGDTFTINAPGVYALSLNDNGSSGAEFGLSLNSSTLSSSISTIAVADRLGHMTAAGTSFGVTVAWTGYLPAGSVVRVHGGGAAAGSPDRSNFTIARVF